MKAISLRLSTLIAALAIGLTQLASASNPVIDWNQIALSTALTTPGTQIYLTYVNLAMYDAVNAIDRRYQQYGSEFHGPSLLNSPDLRFVARDGIRASKDGRA